MTSNIQMGSGLPPVDFKMAILGGSAVGKTSLMRALFKKPFTNEHIPTIDDYIIHALNQDGVHYNVCLVDTGGSFCFPVMRKFAISYCEGFVVMYAMNDARSFQTALDTLDEIIETKCGLGPHKRRIPVIMVANKSDCADREITAAQAQRELDDRPWIVGMYAEVSAKVNAGVDGIFYSLISLVQAMTDEERNRMKASSVRRSRKSWRKR
ncbi:predicted protein [Nematostella vectensis]|uniref:Small monomeric GTPase n=1 Tax=Nematostella vectensis TaxID=45351 RepID=A7RZ86_NEMVE|nr:predicted protein [Nematostella vectensis]|eukprot:XP_001635303.1 predicted protein [Nematostella vectensis]